MEGEAAGLADRRGGKVLGKLKSLGDFLLLFCAAAPAVRIIPQVNAAIAAILIVFISVPRV